MAMRVLCLACICVGASVSISHAFRESALGDLTTCNPPVVIRVELQHTFPVPASEAFAYITDMKRWPEYWPDFVRIHDPANARWSRPGDRATIVLRLLGRERSLNMTLTEFRKDAFVAYVSQQEGLPDIRHERQFSRVPGGFEYRLVVAYEPRRGLNGLVDRLLLKRGVAAALRRTIEKLKRVFS